MISIVGIVAVIAAILGGFLMEHGNLGVLIQPSELVIIGGSALGTLLIANRPLVIIQIFRTFTNVLCVNKYDKKHYLSTLTLLFGLFQKARKAGAAAIESDIENPQASELFKNYPEVLKDVHLMVFICDTFRIGMVGNVGHHELDEMIGLDLEVHRKVMSVPVNAVSRVADALPGLGIISAVLGVVITMGSLGGPPEEIGKRVAAALVGTFLGILMCYGFLSPIAAKIAESNETELLFYDVLRAGLIAFFRGNAPRIAVEFSRRSIPAPSRPSFEEMEQSFLGTTEKVQVLPKGHIIPETRAS